MPPRKAAIHSLIKVERANLCHDDTGAGAGAWEQVTLEASNLDSVKRYLRKIPTPRPGIFPPTWTCAPRLLYEREDSFELMYEGRQELVRLALSAERVIYAAGHRRREARCAPAQLCAKRK